MLQDIEIAVAIVREKLAAASKAATSWIVERERLLHASLCRCFVRDGRANEYVFLGWLPLFFFAVTLFHATYLHIHHQAFQRELVAELRSSIARDAETNLQRGNGGLAASGVTQIAKKADRIVQGNQVGGYVDIGDDFGAPDGKKGTRDGRPNGPRKQTTAPTVGADIRLAALSTKSSANCCVVSNFDPGSQGFDF